MPLTGDDLKGVPLFAGLGDKQRKSIAKTLKERTATITATTDLRCSGMTSWQFRPLVEKDATLAWGLLQALARMLG